MAKYKVGEFVVLGEYANERYLGEIVAIIQNYYHIRWSGDSYTIDYSINEFDTLEDRRKATDLEILLFG